MFWFCGELLTQQPYGALLLSYDNVTERCVTVAFAADCSVPERTGVFCLNIASAFDVARSH